MESEKLSDYPFVHPQRYRSIPGNTDSKYEQNNIYIYIYIHIYIYMYIYIEFHVVLFFFKLTFGILGSVIN